MVYIAQKDKDFPPNKNPTAELVGDDNIVSFSNIDITIKPGVQYKWRVDCVEGATSNRRIGDTWDFTMNE